jgi:hypothetical protein
MGLYHASIATATDRLFSRVTTDIVTFTLRYNFITV